MPGWTRDCGVKRLETREATEKCGLCQVTSIGVTWQKCIHTTEDSETGFEEYEYDDPIKIVGGVYFPDNPYHPRYIICDKCHRIIQSDKKNNSAAYNLLGGVDSDIQYKEFILDDVDKYISGIKHDVNSYYEKFNRLRSIFTKGE
jgi:hypothetical protein